MADHSATSAVPVLTDEIVQRLRDIAGEDSVVLSDDLLADPGWPLQDPNFIPGDQRHTPSVAVHPTTVEQIQAIVAIANETGIPLWTHGQGRNNAYGGPSPVVPGSISISLRRMNRVLEVNEELAYAVVEPGVRWTDLNDELRRRGSRLALSVPDIGWGSVVGNSLDNGATYMPTGTDMGAPCGLEVVLATGELLRTGMGAMPGNPAWRVYKRGIGPVLDPLFSQSNYGIVTQMGVWLMPRPEVYVPLTLTAENEDDLAQVVDTLRELRLAGVLRGVPAMFGTALTPDLMAIRDPELMTVMLERGAPDQDDWMAYRKRHGLGKWNVRAALYGSAEVVDAALMTLERAWSKIPDARVRVDGRFAPDQYDQLKTMSQKVCAGIPTLDMLETWTPELGHLDISPVLPMEGHRVAEVMTAVRTFIAARFDGPADNGALYQMGERSCVIIFGLGFVVSDEPTVRKAFDVGRELVDMLADMGYSEYRAHVHLMDHVAEKFSFGDHAYRRFCEAIKDAVDPNGILSPGRYGIWPKRMRS